MASSITFILKEPKSSEPTLIYLILRFNAYKVNEAGKKTYQQLKFSTGLKWKPEHWNSKKHKGRDGSDFPDPGELNQRIRNMEMVVSDIYRKLINNGIAITSENIREEIDKRPDVFPDLKRKAVKANAFREKPKTLIDFFEQYIISNEGAGANSFSSTMKNLKSNTSYYVRAYATNSDGTGYGNTMTFTTQKDLTDIDGNVYQTVTIGTQVWMVGNLKVTKFNDGTPISLVTDDLAWSNLTTSGYCFYNNDESTYKKNYGALYNWYAVGTGKLAPVGWHIPSDDEWTVLTDFLGGSNNAGGKLKETGTTDWISPNTGATNETNFTALPGGNRGQNAGFFEEVGTGGFWWTSTESGSYYSYFRSVGNNHIVVGRSGSLRINGLSVRCIKD